MTSAEELIAIGRQYYREGRFAVAERAFDRPRYRVVDLELSTVPYWELKNSPVP